ncbi:MAG: hypothetical protein HFE89_05915, partial [Acutalibacter sp.]|nr:hypothetical protein [Acutalibacter sp.]
GAGEKYCAKGRNPFENRGKGLQNRNFLNVRPIKAAKQETGGLVECMPETLAAPRHLCKFPIESRAKSQYNNVHRKREMQFSVLKLAFLGFPLRGGCPGDILLRKRAQN